MDLNTLAIIKKYVDKKVINGLSGKSAYQIAIDNGFEGTEQEWLNSLSVKIDETTCFISSTNDTTDRTEEIQSILTEKKSCILGPGEFYIRGVELPEGAMVRGLGNATKVRYIENNDTKYIFKLNSNCSISDMLIRGTAPGGRENTRSWAGILIEGSYGINNSVTEGPGQCTLSNLYIVQIKGAGIKIANTGTSPKSHAQITSCNICYCDIGILLDTYAEFNMISTVACNTNYYGIIVKGGNNRISNSDFSKNSVGIWMPCENQPNHGHGNFVGCEIAHSGENEGYAIICDYNESGERFEACTIGYGIVHVKNCRGISFSNCGFGNITFQIEDSIGTCLNGCSIGASTSLTEIGTNTNTHIINCFNRNDGSSFIIQ